MNGTPAPQKRHLSGAVNIRGMVGMFDSTVDADPRYISESSRAKVAPLPRDDFLERALELKMSGPIPIALGRVPLPRPKMMRDLPFRIRAFFFGKYAIIFCPHRRPN